MYISGVFHVALLILFSPKTNPYLTPDEFLPPANELCKGYVFTGVCLSTGHVHGKGGMGHAWGGMCGRGHASWGHAWQVTCVVGACIARGHVWWGHAW